MYKFSKNHTTLVFFRPRKMMLSPAPWLESAPMEPAHLTQGEGEGADGEALNLLKYFYF